MPGFQQLDTVYNRTDQISLTERYICAKLLSRGLLEFENLSIASTIAVVVNAVSHQTVSRAITQNQRLQSTAQLTNLC